MGDEYLSSKSIDGRAILAAVDRVEAERLIEEFRPFLRACAARYCNDRYSAHFDELNSTAMLAFYEAIGSYDAAKGHFFPFAGGVIRRRLIDYVRKTYNNRVETLSISDSTDSAPSIAILKASEAQHTQKQQHAALVEELEQYRAELAAWNITLDKLVEQSPKHTRLRSLCHNAVRQIATDAGILRTIREKRYFPIARISEVSGIPPKKLERVRIYIIAMLIIYMGDYSYLGDYLEWKRR